MSLMLHCTGADITRSTVTGTWRPGRQPDHTLNERMPTMARFSNRFAILSTVAGFMAVLSILAFRPDVGVGPAITAIETGDGPGGAH